MSVVVECCYVYTRLDWTAINEHSNGLRRKILVDSESAYVAEEKREDGSVAYTSVVKTPMWAQLFLPAECQWLDLVSIDFTKRERTEHGRNLTRYDDGIVIEERSRWWQDPDGSGDTFFHRRLEVSLRGVPNYFVRLFGGLYRHHTMQLRQEEAVEIRAAMALRPQTKKSNDCRSIDGGAGFGKEGSGSRKGSSSVTRSDRSNSGTAANSSSSSSSSSRDTAVQNGALDRATSRPRSALSDATHLAAEAPVISSPSTPPSTPQQPPSQTSSSSSPLTRPPLEDWLAEICGLSRNSNSSGNSSTETGSTKAVAVAVLRWAYIAITVFAFALLFEVVNRHAETLWCDDGGHDSAQLAAVIAAAHDNKPTQLRPSEEALATITNAVTTIVQPLHDLVMDGVSWAAVTPLLLLAYLAGRFTPN